MPLSPAEMQAKIDKFEVNLTRLDAITNGADNADVVVDSGTVPTIAKFFKTIGDTAGGYVTTAQTAASQAAASRDKAALWSDSPTQVETGRYSAKHWADAAAGTVSGVATFNARSGSVVSAVNDYTTAQIKDGAGVLSTHLTTIDNAIDDLADEIDAKGMPVGSVIMMYGNDSAAPPGYLLMNGAQITSTYPDLRAYGLARGWPTVSGNPVVADMGGYFPRGWRTGQVVDSGRVFGVTQDDAFQAHIHEQLLKINSYSSSAPSTEADIPGGSTANTSVVGPKSGGNATVSNFIGAAKSDGVNGTPRTASETRPDNVTFTYWIKAFDTPVDASSINVTALSNSINAQQVQITRAQKYARLQDQKAANTAGGATVATTWTTITLNTEVVDADSIVTLASNAFTVTVNCKITARKMFYAVGIMRIRLYNVTDSVVVAQSVQVQCGNPGTAAGAVIELVAQGVAGKQYRVEYYCPAVVANGMGVAVNAAGTVEVYAEVEIEGWLV